LNYRHAFHAGNFADVMKHAILLELLAAFTREAGALTVIDTHAGAGIHDLRGGEAARTGEAAGGVARLMAGQAPAPFNALKAAVRRANRGEEVRFYPGSPLLIADALRARDRLIACELRPDDYAALKATLPRQAGAEALREDGWRLAADRARGAGRLLVLTDPPYEDPSDGAKAARMVGEVLRASPQATLAIWAPIKDLDSFYGLVETIRDAAGRAPVMLAQSRLRPLTNPMTMNGSAMIVLNPPAGVLEACDEISRWTAETLGERGALGRAEML
jgi:23S rRNA (adenine2030-N6)-methyltransferase